MAHRIGSNDHLDRGWERRGKCGQAFPHEAGFAPISRHRRVSAGAALLNPLVFAVRRRADRTVTLSQIMHLTLRCILNANFDDCLRTDPPTRVRSAMTRTAPFFASPNGTVRSFSRRG
jgi:hypothetical protein